MKKQLITLAAVMFACAGVVNAQVRVVKVHVPGGVKSPHVRGVLSLAKGTPDVLSRYSGVRPAVLQRSVAKAQTAATKKTYSQILASHDYHYYDVTTNRWMLHKADGTRVLLVSKPFKSALITRADVIRKYVAEHGEDAVIADTPMEGDVAWETYAPVQTRHFTTFEESMRRSEYTVNVPNGKGGYDTYLRSPDGTITLQNP